MAKRPHLFGNSNIKMGETLLQEEEKTPLPKSDGAEEADEVNIFSYFLTLFWPTFLVFSDVFLQFFVAKESTKAFLNVLGITLQ